MDKKAVVENIIKNRFLILGCAMLIAGTFFGMSMLKIIPEEICVNLYNFISKTSDDLFNLFINKFSFPFLIMICLYFSGTSIFGVFSALLGIFINGFIFGFENSLKYEFIGINYIVNSTINFFTSAVFINLILVIMTENSIFYSRQLSDIICNKNPEKSHYNTKNMHVKFLTFTVILAIISFISACFSLFIQPVL